MSYSCPVDFWAYTLNELHMTNLIGRIFDGKYRLTKLIGEGGMGAVYEAEHTRIERKVAVKVMHPEFTSSKEVVNRFFREAKASSAIGHPNIIEIFDVGQDEDGSAFIVMQLLLGQSLATRLKTGGRMAPGDAATVILQVLSALAVSHAKGIIHRDLKPDNVFLAVDNRGRHEVKLLDFGIAKMQSESEGDLALTKTGTVLGTPNYMSPEAARGKEIDGRIDIWAAGVMLYEMLCANLPFSGQSYNAVLSDILLETPRPISAIVPDIPSGLIRVVEKAMEKDRDKRYQTVTAMIADLLPFVNNSAMSDSASFALKQSLVPPPPEAFNDTVLSTSMSPLSLTVSDDALELQAAAAALFGKPLKKPKRRGVRAVFAVLLVAVIAIVGLSFLLKQPSQTIVESGIGLMNIATSYWKTSPLWPFARTFGIAPDGDEPAEILEPINEADGGVSDDSSVLELFALSIIGAPEGSVITLNGVPIAPQSTVEGFEIPQTLKVVAPKNRVFEKDVVLDQNMEIQVKLKADRKHSSKSKKHKAKKSPKSK